MFKQFLFGLMALAIWAACTPAAEQQAKADQHEETVAATTDEVITYPEDSVSADGLRSYHGLRIDETNAVPIAELTSLMDQHGGLEGAKFEGPIAAVCQAKGCWMTMTLANGEDMRVRFRDYGFFVPKDSPGKIAIIEGNAYRDTTSVEDLRHYAVDGGMSEEEAAAKYTEPEVVIAFEATGVIIKDDSEG
ncbi:MAG: DUF4920 domain-containing protein [Bacteroidetes bacterium]|nr:MAG: DUF4920 domain-containing protein [Bacteroidota bacterium]